MNSSTPAWRRDLFVLVAVLWSYPCTQVAAQTTALFVDSQPGEFIGRGVRQTLTAADGQFTTSPGSGAVVIRFQPPHPASPWSLTFSAAGDGLNQRGVAPAVGAYESARPFYGLSPANGLTVSGNANGCSSSSGRFVVREAEYDVDGRVVRFAADFEQHCEGGDLALFGAVRYNSGVSDLVPFGGDYPRNRLTIAAPSHGSVTGGGLSCGSLPGPCLVDLTSPATITLTASADSGYFFAGWTGDCSGKVTTSVRINALKACSALFQPMASAEPRTLSVLTGRPDPIGRDRDRVLSQGNSVWRVDPRDLANRFMVWVRSIGPTADAYSIFSISPPTGQTLQPGMQYQTARIADATHAGFDLTTDYSGCGHVSGSMNVREWIVDGSGTPQRLAVDFQIQCVGEGTVAGTLQYRSLFPYGVVEVDHASLNFGAAASATGIVTHTPDQQVRISVSGSGATWRASADQPWVTVSPAAGTGSGELTVGVRDSGQLPSTGRVTAKIFIAAQGSLTVVPPIDVGLNVYRVGATTAPSGAFETPIDGANVQGSIAVTGWALDDVRVDRVEIWRDLAPGETTPPFQAGPGDPRAGKVFVANGVFIDGARPDVAAMFPSSPMNGRAGWGYLLLTWGLWNRGEGTFTLHAFAFDHEGQVTALGSKRINSGNINANRPFGSIDSPGIGATVAGTVINLGWALTPMVRGEATCRIPSNGVQVSIDSGPLQPVVFGDPRPDVAAAFAGMSNANAAGGHFTVDTTQYSNGTHTIGWLVSDDCRRSDGVGSRFFTVNNGSAIAAPQNSSFRSTRRADESAVLVARGYGELPESIPADAQGMRAVHLRQSERIELLLPRGVDDAYQLVADRRRALPIGSTWDSAAGIFYWQPAAGFLGSYELMFIRGPERIRIRVVVSER